MGAELDLGPAHVLNSRQEIFWNNPKKFMRANFVFYSASVACQRVSVEISKWKRIARL